MERQRLPAPDFRAMIRKHNPDVRGAFCKQFDAEIEATGAHLQVAYENLLGFEDAAPASDRSGLTGRFLVHALNSVVISTQLLLDGMTLASGNMMRHYGEASAVALLMSHEKLPDFESWRQHPHTYSSKNAANRVNQAKTRKLLGISEAGWKLFMENTRSYDSLSHASTAASEHNLYLAQENTVSFGGDYDPGKLEFYKLEMQRRRTAAEIMTITIRACAGNLGVR